MDKPCEPPAPKVKTHVVNTTAFPVSPYGISAPCGYGGGKKEEPKAPVPAANLSNPSAKMIMEKVFEYTQLHMNEKSDVIKRLHQIEVMSLLEDLVKNLAPKPDYVGLLRESLTK